jgi:hypothetical protein
MARRTSLKPEDKRLLDCLRWQQWTAEDLRWVLAHLDAAAPVLVVQTLRAQLREMEGQEGGDHDRAKARQHILSHRHFW